MAIVDYFLKIDGIPGESTDVQHKNEIEIKDFSFGVENPTRIGSATGGSGAGKVRFNEFQITKTTDKSSPNLFLKCASGQHLKDAVLSVRKAGGDPKTNDFLKVTFSDVLISSYQDAARSVGPLTPPADVVSTNDDATDSVSLRYAKLDLVQGTPQRITVPPTAGGTLTFNAKTNQVTVGDWNGDGIATVGTLGGNVTRAAQEFDVKILIGLLTSPFSTARLGLLVDQVLRPVIAPNAAGAKLNELRVAGLTRDNDDSDEDHDRPKPHARGVRFDVLLYRDADGVINASDLTRPAKRIGQLTVDPTDPNSLASLDVDLGAILLKHDTDTFGIRLQLHGAGIRDGREDADDVAKEGDQGHDRDDEDDERVERRGDGGVTPDASASFRMALVFLSAT